MHSWSVLTKIFEPSWDELAENSLILASGRFWPKAATGNFPIFGVASVRFTPIPATQMVIFNLY